MPTIKGIYSLDKSQSIIQDESFELRQLNKFNFMKFLPGHQLYRDSNLCPQRIMALMEINKSKQTIWNMATT